jgi:hypothetical protein
MFENIVIYDGYDIEQSKQIKLGEDKHLKVEVYKNPDFDYRQMEQIRLGLEEGLNVAVYAKTIYVADQMFQIRKGLKDNLDVTIYADPSFAADQMWQLRMGILDGINVSKYADPKFSAKDMERFRRQETENLYIVEELKKLTTAQEETNRLLSAILTEIKQPYHISNPVSPVMPAAPSIYHPQPVDPWYEVTCESKTSTTAE